MSHEKLHLSEDAAPRVSNNDSNVVVARLSNICKSFNGVPALVDAKFELKKG